MVQLNIVNGSQAGARVVARRFPFKIGRGRGNDFICEDPGVWDEHCSLYSDKEGVHLRAAGAALLSVNHMQVREHRLQNGDMIALGGLKILFSMSPTRQRGLLLRESFLWSILLLLTLGQVALIYWLLLNV